MLNGEIKAAVQTINDYEHDINTLVKKIMKIL